MKIRNQSNTQITAVIKFINAIPTTNIKLININIKKTYIHIYVQKGKGQGKAKAMPWPCHVDGEGARPKALPRHRLGLPLALPCHVEGGGKTKSLPWPCLALLRGGAKAYSFLIVLSFFRPRCPFTGSSKFRAGQLPQQHFKKRMHKTNAFFNTFAKEEGTVSPAGPASQPRQPGQPA